MVLDDSMMPIKAVACLLSLVFLGGCVQAEKIGSIVKYHVQGSHYIETRNYAKGETLFRQAVQKNPESPQANYFLGRFLLAEKKKEKAQKEKEENELLDKMKEENGNYTF